MSFFPITCIVICKCICKWRNMLCIRDKRGSSTLLTFISSSGLVLRKALKLFSPQGVLIFLCSLHCVIVEPGPFSGNTSILVPGHEMPYRARVGAFIILWGAGVENWKAVCCACDGFSCGGSDLLCLWLARLTESLQGLLPRVYPVAGVMVSAGMNKRGWSSFVGLAGSRRHRQNRERALPVDVAARELPSSEECRSAPGAWTELANCSTVGFLFAYASSPVEIALTGKK